MPDILNLKEYQSSLSLKSVAGDNINPIFNLLAQNESLGDFVVGYHIRHFLDTDSPTYVAKSKNAGQQINLDNIIQENKNEGKHTLNHVIDTLFYPKSDDKDSLIEFLIKFNDNNELNPKTELNGFEFNPKTELNGFEVYPSSASFNFENCDSVFNVAHQIYDFIRPLEIDKNIVNFEALYNALNQLNSFKDFGSYTTCFIYVPKVLLDMLLEFLL